MIQTFNKLVLILSLVVPSLTWAKECETLKYIFLKESTYKDSDLADLKKGIEEENPCLKNLMGIMLYQGIYFQKDTERAEQVFMDLSNNDYPEAQFNFALAMTKRLDQDPEVIMSFLIGLYYKYADDTKNSSLASLSRDLGRKYTESLDGIQESCSGNNKCGAKLLKMSAQEIANIRTNFAASIKSAESKVANARLQLSKNTKDEADALVSILSLGIIAYNLSYAGNFNNGMRGVNGTEIWNSPWTNGNPLHQNLYQWPKPF